MDAKERHELKDNDLAEFLENFGAFWNKHGNIISAIILFAVAGWLGLRYYKAHHIARQENAWADLASTTTPQGYRERAKEDSGIGGLGSVALLRGAEAYHKQAINLLEEEAKPDSGVMSPQDSLANAQKMYKQVLDSNADAVYRANAAAGLANVCETLEDFDAAKTYWTQADELAKAGRLETIAALAETRLKMLDELAQPIVFGESPEFTIPSGSMIDQAPGQDITEMDSGEVELKPEPTEQPDAETVESPADAG